MNGQKPRMRPAAFTALALAAALTLPGVQASAADAATATYKIQWFKGTKSGKYPATAIASETRTDTAGAKVRLTRDDLDAPRGYALDKKNTTVKSVTVAGDNSTTVSVYFKADEKATDLFQQGNLLWTTTTSGDPNNDGKFLSSTTAQNNLKAMKYWYRSAKLGDIGALDAVVNYTYYERGGFVRDDESNIYTPYYGVNMGNNIKGESGWSVIRRFGLKAVHSGLANLKSLDNSGTAQSDIYHALAESYANDEMKAIYPDMIDYKASLPYYLAAANSEGDFKGWRYVAELYWFGRLAPDSGTTAGEEALQYMEKAATGYDSTNYLKNDATANAYLGFWYLNEDGTGPDLPIPAGETKVSMALKYFTRARAIADHGTIRKMQEALEKLAQIYETGENETSGVPTTADLQQALSVYNEMLSAAYYPGTQKYVDAAARVEAKLAAIAEGGKTAVVHNGAPITLDHAAIVQDGEVLVPSTALDSLGLTTDYDEASQTLTAANADSTLKLTAGSDRAVVGHTDVKMDATAKIVDGELFVPLLFVAKSIGLDASYDATVNTASLSDPAAPAVSSDFDNGGNAVVSFGGRDWIVLAKKDDRQLIVAKDDLTAAAYNSAYNPTTGQALYTTWENSELRSYLNGTFYDTFSADDQSKIISTRIGNTPNTDYKTLAGSDTTDNIFVLSQQEYETYIGTDQSLVSTLNSDGSNWWWLRTPGVDQRYAAFANSAGFVASYGRLVTNPLGGVRPAMWIKIPATDPGTHPTMTVTQTGAHQLTATFDRALDAASASFSIVKDGSPLDISYFKWAEDSKSVVFTTPDDLTDGSYTVDMANVSNGRTLSGTLVIGSATTGTDD
ncbi:DUF6273 domain-containing protein [Streptomyces sp. NPDC051985]|uniref:DUF6273 domain-containing protein n=1 Tax=Streptomyces sp. NPDC051985 TaxID=3155807 RepID=UPI00343B485C